MNAAVDDDDPMTTLTGDMRRVLEAQQALGWKPVEELTPAQARRQPTLAQAAAQVLQAQGKSLEHGDVASQALQYGTGTSVQALRTYRASTAAATAPVILYFHGGGWVDGDLELGENSAIALARRTGALVVSADYSRAPEHRFPAAHADALTAYQWLLGQAAGLGGDPRRIALVGEAAGGNLAANVAVQVRDSGRRQPVHLALIHPIVGTDTGSYSYNRNETARPLSKAGMRWYFKQAIDPKDLQDKRLNLGDFNLGNLPNTTIVTADVDPLMFEGKLLGHKLESSNVPTRYMNYEGVTHGFFGLDAVLREARDAQALVAEQLNAAFATSGPK
jgi:acetyl esterase/lipase